MNPANEDEVLPEGILVSEERLGIEDTPANEWREEFEQLTKYIDFNDRSHTCEGWNGLGDDFYGKAVPTDDEYRKKLKDFIQNLIDSRDAEIARLKEELEDMRLEAKNE
jgi:hypothetical protein